MLTERQPVETGLFVAEFDGCPPDVHEAVSVAAPGGSLWFALVESIESVRKLRASSGSQLVRVMPWTGWHFGPGYIEPVGHKTLYSVKPSCRGTLPEGWRWAE